MCQTHLSSLTNTPPRVMHGGLVAQIGNKATEAHS